MPLFFPLQALVAFINQNKVLVSSKVYHMVVTTNITKGRYETVSSTLKMEVGTVQDKSRGTTFHGLSMKANMSPYLASNYKNE